MVNKKKNAYPYILCCFLCFWGKWVLAFPLCLPVQHRAAESLSTSLDQGVITQPLEYCNCVTSNLASKLLQPVLSTLTGGPAKKGFMTLSQRVAFMRCSPVRSHSFSLAFCLHLLHWVHTQRGNVSQMHADKLTHESGKIRFVQRKHTLSTSPCVNFPLLYSVSFLLSF